MLSGGLRESPRSPLFSIPSRLGHRDAIVISGKSRQFARAPKIVSLKRRPPQCLKNTRIPRCQWHGVRAARALPRNISWGRGKSCTSSAARGRRRLYRRGIVFATGRTSFRERSESLARPQQQRWRRDDTRRISAAIDRPMLNDARRFPSLNFVVLRIRHAAPRPGRVRCPTAWTRGYYPSLIERAAFDRSAQASITRAGLSLRRSSDL